MTTAMVTMVMTGPREEEVVEGEAGDWAADGAGNSMSKKLFVEMDDDDDEREREKGAERR